VLTHDKGAFDNNERLALVIPLPYRGSMAPTQKHQTELAAICEGLREVLKAQMSGDSRRVITQILRRAERLAESIANAPAELGSKGGRETAKRGSDYFRELAAMRKTHGGGRPKIAD
jgi:hypothetical protein